MVPCEKCRNEINPDVMKNHLKICSFAPAPQKQNGSKQIVVKRVVKKVSKDSGDVMFDCKYCSY